MTANCFVDSNLLVYAWDGSDPAKQQRAQAWLDALWGRASGRLSMQVLHEFYVTITRKLHPPVERTAAQAEMDNLLAWRPVPLDGPLLQRAWAVETRFQLHFWDALIVAAAHASGCRYLVSEDLQSGQDLDGVRVVNPFATEPMEILGT